MSLGDTIRGGVQWSTIGTLALQFLGFASGVVLARLLVPEDFGILVTIQIFTGMAGFVAGGGMGQALIRAKEVRKSDYDTVLTLQLIIGCLIYGCFFLIAPKFAIWYDTPIYEILLRVSALTFILRPFSNLPSSLLHRAMRFKAKTIVGIGTQLTSATVSIWMAWSGYGVWSLVLGGLAGSVAGIILNSVFARWRPGFRLDLVRGRSLAGYGLLVSANDVVVYLRQQTSNFVIGRMIGAAAVGLFNKGLSLNSIPSSSIGVSAYNVILRALASIQDNRDQSKYVYLRTITLVLVYLLPFYVGFWWVAEPFVVGVYGEKWIDAAIVLRIVSLAAVFRCIELQSGAVTAARNLLGKELWVQLLIWAVLAAVTTWACRWGIFGVAWAAAGVWILSSCLMALLACRELRVSLRELLKTIMPAGMLNVILIAALALIETALPAGLGSNRPLVYTLIMGTCGGAIYAASFLYLPIPQLSAEAERWRTRLHLSWKALPQLRQP